MRSITFSKCLTSVALMWIRASASPVIVHASTTSGYRRTAAPISSGEVRRYPAVVDACTITGEADALVHIRAADVRHFEDVMERIRAESFVVRTKSVIVLSRLVDRADPPATLR